MSDKEIEENIMEIPCPHCGEIIKVIGCRTCQHVHKNMEGYENAKECWDCDMLHNNYKKKEGE